MRRNSRLGMLIEVAAPLHASANTRLIIADSRCQQTTSTPVESSQVTPVTLACSENAAAYSSPLIASTKATNTTQADTDRA